MSVSRALVSPGLGSVLKEYREWAGYSRGALGGRVGILAEQLERWEVVGIPVPPSPRFLALADFLDIPESALDAALPEEAGRDCATGPARYQPRDPMEVHERADLALQLGGAVSGQDCRWRPAD